LLPTEKAMSYLSTSIIACQTEIKNIKCRQSSINRGPHLVHLFPNDAGPTNIPIRIEKEPKMATSKKTTNVAAKTPSK
jgi:hypothetical protein